MLSGPIENYKFNASTPVEELMVMCRLLSEVGSYSSAVFDRQHQLTARKCDRAQKKVGQELIRREGEDIIDNVFEIPQEAIDSFDLSKLSIDELERLYRQRPNRVVRRMADGREIFTRFFETRIESEIRRRKAPTALEQLKKDYCIRTNRNELNNISRLLQMPLGVDSFDSRA